MMTVFSVDLQTPINQSLQNKSIHIPRELDHFSTRIRSPYGCQKGWASKISRNSADGCGGKETGDKHTNRFSIPLRLHQRVLFLEYPRTHVGIAWEAQLVISKTHSKGTCGEEGTKARHIIVVASTGHIYVAWGGIYNRLTTSEIGENFDKRHLKKSKEQAKTCTSPLVPRFVQLWSPTSTGS